MRTLALLLIFPYTISLAAGCDGGASQPAPPSTAPPAAESAKEKPRSGARPSNRMDPNL